MATIGFIGLGNMGGPMAANLVKSGHTVKVFDLVEENMKSLVAEGAEAASSASDAVSNVEFVVTMLPAAKHVHSLFVSDASITEAIAKGTLIIDSSTIDASTAQDVGKHLKKQGLDFIDAPVSGGVGGAKSGMLTFIVGGESTKVKKAHPVLSAMGKNIFHAGDVGAGQVAKICNNMLLAILMTGTSEALQMGIKHGLDPKVLSDIMLQSSGRNWTLELYNPCPDVLPNVPSSNDYEGGFMVDLMKKDLGLAMEAANQSQSMTPMGALAQNLYNIHSSQGNGKRDFSSIFQLFGQTKH